MNADNASSNNMQMTKLASMDNSFNEAGCMHCFNHTLQLSVKTLLKPFNAALSSTGAADDQATDEGDDSGDNNDLPALEANDDDEDEDNEDAEQRDISDDVSDNIDDIDDVDELAALDEEDHESLLSETAIVCATVSKVCLPSLQIVFHADLTYIT